MSACVPTRHNRTSRSSRPPRASGVKRPHSPPPPRGGRFRIAGADLSASITVFLLAVPMSLGLAVAMDAPLEALLHLRRDRRHRRRTARRHPAPGQRPVRRTDRCHSRVDPDLRLAHHLRDHHRRRTPPDPARLTAGGAQRPRRQPRHRPRHPRRHRRGHRARPTAHRARRLAAEFSRSQRPRAPRPVGPGEPCCPTHRHADHHRPDPVAPDPGPGRQIRTTDSGCPRRGGDRYGGGCDRRARYRPGRSAVLALARPA